MSTRNRYIFLVTALMLGLLADARANSINTEFFDGIYNPQNKGPLPPAACTIVADFTTGCVFPPLGGF
jgi:hypothetical protein